jgi:hypothetical protein
MLVQALLTTILLFLGYRVLQGVYNVFFHPLRKFRGPFLARVSVWWRVWVEVFRGESWVRKLEEVHGYYGEFEVLSFYCFWMRTWVWVWAWLSEEALG